MNRTIVALVLVVLSVPSWAGDFATCVLDKMPGSSNGATHAAVIQACGGEHPGRFFNIKKGSGRGLFGFKDGNACTIDKAKQTSFQPSAGVIAVACRCLYDKASMENDTCANPFDR